MTNRAPTDAELREWIDAMNAPDPDDDSQRREWDDTYMADKPDLETVLDDLAAGDRTAMMEDDSGLDLDDFAFLVVKVRAKRRAKIEQILEAGLDTATGPVPVELANDPIWGWVFRETDTLWHPAEYRIRKYV